MSSASEATGRNVPVLDGDIPEPGGRPPSVFDFDWLTEIAIPLGVFGLLGSLIYYLIEVRSVLAGAGSIGPLRWVVFWFLLAVIGIARIRTKYGGAAIAGYYTALLAGSIAVFVWVYTGRLGSMYGGGGGGDHTLTLLFNWSLVGIVWWAATAVTREATLEENVETQLEGGLWTLLADEWQYPDAEDQPEQEVDQAKVRPRHPGRLVLWVSLAALVLFAIGQRTMGSEGGHARTAFWCMSLYVLFALLLLALTNLSALRMSVRRRGISLSPAVTPAWIVASCIIVVAIIMFASAMPRGITEIQDRRLVQVPDWLTDSERPGPEEGPAEGMGREGDQPGGEEEDGRGPGEEDEAGEGDEEREGGGQGSEEGDEDGAGGRGEEDGEGEGEGQGQGGETEPAPPPPPNPERESLARLLMWLMIAAAAAAIIFFVIVHRRTLLAWLSGLRVVPGMIASALARMWARLMGLLTRRGGRSGGAASLPADPFVDIFAQGLADDLEPAQVVDYVYRAFGVYMARQGFERAEDQTALEFLRAIPKHALLPDRAAERLTRAWVLATYSPREVSVKQVEGARETWHLMKELLAEAGDK